MMSDWQKIKRATAFCGGESKKWGPFTMPFCVIYIIRQNCQSWGFRACKFYQVQSNLDANWLFFFNFWWTYYRYSVPAKWEEIQLILSCFYKISCKWPGQEHFIKTHQTKSNVKYFSIAFNFWKSGASGHANSSQNGNGSPWASISRWKMKWYSLE